MLDQRDEIGELVIQFENNINCGQFLNFGTGYYLFQK